MHCAVDSAEVQGLIEELADKLQIEPCEGDSSADTLHVRQRPVLREFCHCNALLFMINKFRTITYVKIATQGVGYPLERRISPRFFVNIYIYGDFSGSDTHILRFVYNMGCFPEISSFPQNVVLSIKSWDSFGGTAGNFETFEEIWAKTRFSTWEITSFNTPSTTANPAPDQAKTSSP